jgi:hypothetical protein
MTTQNKMKTVLTLAAVAMAFLATSAQAATTITGTAGGTDSWNTAANWDNGVPSGAVDAIVSDGVLAQVLNAATPTYSGSLTLNANSTLSIGNVGGSQNAFVGASRLTMNTGSTLSVNINANLTYPPITLLGPATLLSPFGASDHQTDNVSAITGAYTLTINGFNNHTYNLNATNTFSALNSIASDRYNIRGKAAGAFGTGDVNVEQRGDQVTPNRSARLYFDVPDVMADTATLYLNGPVGGGGYTGDGVDWVVINHAGNETIGGLYIYGVQQPYGTYDSSETWLGGAGTLTVKAPDPNLPFVDVGPDMISWSGALVALDPNVVNNDTNEPQGTLTYAWSADPVDGVEFSATDVLAPTVTITKATANPSPVTLTLAVTLPGKDPVTDTMTIDVYDDSCLAAKAAGLVEIDPTDFDENCITNFADFAVMAATWLDDYSLTGPVAK